MLVATAMNANRVITDYPQKTEKWTKGRKGPLFEHMLKARNFTALWQLINHRAPFNFASSVSHQAACVRALGRKLN